MITIKFIKSLKFNRIKRKVKWEMKILILKTLNNLSKLKILRYRSSKMSNSMNYQEKNW
jgi:hypothetical protein